MEIEHDITEVPKKNSGRPKGTYSETGAAIRRLNTGERIEISCKTDKQRISVSSLACIIGKQLNAKYVTRYFREQQSLIIYRTL